MSLQDLTTKQHDFLVLTRSSGSPYHPFVRALSRLLGLPELVADDARGTKAGDVVAPNDADIAIVRKHHTDPREQGQLYRDRIPALEALLK
jgi:hypothetical protein